MPLQLNDTLLHKETKHSNIDLPISPYVNYDKFPEQNKDLLSTIISLKIRDRYEADRSIDDVSREEISEGDVDFDTNIWTDNFIVIRCDAAEPYKMICVSTDYTRLVVTDSRYYSTIVAIYPDQLIEFLGLKVLDQYYSDIREYDGVIIGCDNGEPCNSVIVESLTDSKEIRIVLEDECQSKIGKIMKINKLDCYYTKESIALLRKTLIEGKKLYGID